MTDPDKTQKIKRIRRTKTREELAEMSRAALAHFQAQAEIQRQRLASLGVAA